MSNTTTNTNTVLIIIGTVIVAINARLLRLKK